MSTVRLRSTARRLMAIVTGWLEQSDARYYSERSTAGFESRRERLIVQLWKARALPESADAYQAHVVTSVFPRIERQKGYRRGCVLRRNVNACVEFLVMTEWTSATAIQPFAADLLDRAVVESAAYAFSSCGTQVEQFEVLPQSD